MAKGYAINIKSNVGKDGNRSGGGIPLWSVTRHQPTLSGMGNEMCASLH